MRNPMVDPAADPLCFQDVESLALGYRQGTRSPIEVAERMLARIERLNPELCAYYEIARTQVLELASVSAARHRAGTALSMLDGVPVSTSATGSLGCMNQAIATIRHTSGMPTMSAFRAPNFRVSAGEPDVSLVLESASVPEFSEELDGVMSELAHVSSTRSSVRRRSAAGAGMNTVVAPSRETGLTLRR